MNACPNATAEPSFVVDPVAEHRDLQVRGRRVHVVTQGDQGPPIVLLHGLPTHAGLWRQVQPALAYQSRTVAIDLPGFGTSEPIDRPHDLAALAGVLDGTLAALAIERPVLVALDLGLLVALQWSARHPQRMRGIVMMEGFFLPMAISWQALPWSARMLMRLARWRWLAERAIVHDGEAVTRFVRAGVLRRLDDEDVARYSQPWADPQTRRAVWLNGIHAGALVPPSRASGDTVAMIDAAARAFEQTAMPKLLLTADPGMVVTPATVAAAQRRLSGLRVVSVGRGRHLLPEDQPDAIAEAVAHFVRGLAP